MKISGITRFDVQSLMGGDASRREAEAMREIILQYEDTYSDTKEISDVTWNEMLICAIDRARNSS